MPLVGAQPLHLAAHAFVLGREGILERQRLAPERDRMLVLRVGAVAGFAKKHDELDVGDE